MTSNKNRLVVGASIFFRMWCKFPTEWGREGIIERRNTYEGLGAKHLVPSNPDYQSYRVGYKLPELVRDTHMCRPKTYLNHARNDN